jgi:hypothetical protein
MILFPKMQIYREIRCSRGCAAIAVGKIPKQDYGKIIACAARTSPSPIFSPHFGQSEKQECQFLSVC